MVVVTGGEESAENDKPRVTMSLVPAFTVMAGCREIVMLTSVLDATDLDKVICKKIVRLKPNTFKYKGDSDVPEGVLSRGPDQKSLERSCCSECRGGL
jgi:hypothetical protein